MYSSVPFLPDFFPMDEESAHVMTMGVANLPHLLAEVVACADHERGVPSDLVPHLLVLIRGLLAKTPGVGRTLPGTITLLTTESIPDAIDQVRLEHLQVSLGMRGRERDRLRLQALWRARTALLGLHRLWEGQLAGHPLAFNQGGFDTYLLQNQYDPVTEAVLARAQENEKTVRLVDGEILQRLGIAPDERTWSIHELVVSVRGAWDPCHEFSL